MATPWRRTIGLGRRHDIAARSRAAARPRQIAALARLDRGGRVDLDGRRRHPRGEDPVLGLLDAGPAALGGAPGIGDVATPQRERGRGQVERHRVLGVADGLELEQHLAEQPAGRLARRQLDLDGGEGDHVLRKLTPAGSHSSAVMLSDRASCQRPSRNSESAALPRRKLP